MNTRRNNGQWSFVDALTMFDTMLQIADFQMNVQQSSNDDIMSVLQSQNEKYLKKIIENQKEILHILSDMKSNISTEKQ